MFEELDMVWSLERRRVYAAWTHRDRVQELAVTSMAEHVIVRRQVKRTVGGQPTGPAVEALKGRLEES